MTKSVFSGVRVTGVAGAVPKTVVDNLTDHAFCPAEDRKKIVALTKVGQYRKSSPDICASDLCFAAAQTLLSNTGTSPEQIDAIVFSTITPDYRAPSTACVLQNRLQCPTSTIAYDITMGCSGFVVGLFNACSLIKGGGLKRVLLLAGDTQSKLCYEEDKNVVFILGDGGTATLLEADENAGDIVIEVSTDGGRFQNLYVPAGGFRKPTSDLTRKVIEQPDGGMRSADHLYMNGMEIFKFSATDVVKSISNFMESESLSSENVDYLFLHQANGFMNEKVARKLKFPSEKVPYTIEFYGNTGSASIPLTMAHHFSHREVSGERSRCLVSGFGVGLSWGVASFVVDAMCAPAIVEVD